MTSEIPPIVLPAIKEIKLPLVTPLAPPVTAQPIIQMPGCVAVHPDAQRNPSLLVDDPSRVGYACPDGEIPSYNPMDYTPSQLTIVEQQPPPQEQKEEQPAPAKPPEQRTEPPGPPANQEQKPKVVEEQGIVDKIVEGLPTLQAATTASGVAVIATASAVLAKPLADLLLKLIKPAIKKGSKKLAQLRKKSLKIQSVRERVLAQRDRNRAIMVLRRALRP